MLRSMTTANELSDSALTMDTCPKPLSLATSTHSSVKGTPQHIREWLMSSQQVFPANPSPLPEEKKGRTTNATSGPKPLRLFARYDRATACWKMYEDYFRQGTSKKSSKGWPKAGILRAGVCYRLPKWEHRISETVFGLWPTPTVNMVSGGANGTSPAVQEGRHGINLAGAVQTWATPQTRDYRTGYAERYDTKPQKNLNDQVAKWPTPTARDSSSRGPSEKERKSPALNHVATGGIGRKLNPDWVEWLMGFPVGWTSLEPLHGQLHHDWQQRNRELSWWHDDPAETPYLPPSGMVEPEIVSRLTEGLPNRVGRLKGLGNGQVPLVVAIAWTLLTEGLLDE